MLCFRKVRRNRSEDIPGGREGSELHLGDGGDRRERVQQIRQVRGRTVARRSHGGRHFGPLRPHAGRLLDSQHIGPGLLLLLELCKSRLLVRSRRDFKGVEERGSVACEGPGEYPANAEGVQFIRAKGGELQETGAREWSVKKSGLVSSRSLKMEGRAN